MFCKNCGNKIIKGVKFCGKCGGKIVGKKPEEDYQEDFQSFNGTTQPFPKTESSIIMKLIKFIAIGLVSIAIIGILSGLVIVALSGNKGSSQQATEENKSWQVYNSVSDQFSVSVPSYPEFDSEDGISVPDTDITYSWHSYTVKKDNVIFYVYKYIYSDIIDISDKDSLLEGYLNEMINADNGFNSISSSYTYHTSHRALDFVASYQNESIKGSIIESGQTPYVLMVEYFSDNDVGADYKKFINSF
jgi:type II secretory pathway pseudopilin PulG